MTTSTEGPDGSLAAVGDYELVDAGVRRRLERFGTLTVDRSAAGADGFRLAPEAWTGTDLRFDPGAGWSGPAWPSEPWAVGIGGLTMELRPTASGGVGLYPEHAANLAWLRAAVAARLDRRADEAAPGGGRGPLVLNLFAHTGLATLAMAGAGASVVHVDGSRGVVAWARRNAELSGLADRPVRWIVDDVAAFVAREARRGRRYDGIVLDPPSFGRAGRAEWRLEDDLPALLAACRQVAAAGAFVLLTAHSESIDGSGLSTMLRTAFRAAPDRAEVAQMDLTATSGATLRLGWSVRLEA